MHMHAALNSQYHLPGNKPNYIHVHATIHSHQLTNMVRWCTITQASLTKIHLVPVVVSDGKDKGFELGLCQFDAAVLLPHNRVCSESNTSAMCTHIIALNLKQSCTRTCNCSPLTNTITRSP